MERKYCVVARDIYDETDIPVIVTNHLSKEEANKFCNKSEIKSPHVAFWVLSEEKAQQKGYK